MTDGPTTLAQAMLPEFDLEMGNTRKTLERVPDGAWGWKPHARSFAMGELATHVANLPSWATLTVNADAFDMAPGGQQMKTPEAASTREALERFDAAVAEARAALAGATDERLRGGWSLQHDGHTIFTLPRLAVLRSFVMNHLIHHRAQLGLYLRMNDVPVPALYGPSADEAGM